MWTLGWAGVDGWRLLHCAEGVFTAPPPRLVHEGSALASKMDFESIAGAAGFVAQALTAAPACCLWCSTQCYHSSFRSQRGVRLLCPDQLL